MSKALLQFPTHSRLPSSAGASERRTLERRGGRSRGCIPLRSRQDGTAAAERSSAKGTDLWAQDPEWMAVIAALAEDF